MGLLRRLQLLALLRPRENCPISFALRRDGGALECGVLIYAPMIQITRTKYVIRPGRRNSPRGWAQEAGPCRTRPFTWFLRLWREACRVAALDLGSFAETMCVVLLTHIGQYVVGVCRWSQTLQEVTAILTSGAAADALDQGFHGAGSSATRRAHGESDASSK